VVDLPQQVSRNYSFLRVHVYKMDPASLQLLFVVFAPKEAISIPQMKAQNRMQDSWFEKLDNVPSNILFGVLPNGWTNNTKAMAGTLDLISGCR